MLDLGNKISHFLFFRQIFLRKNDFKPCKTNYSAINLPKNFTLSREDAKFLIINGFWLLTCCRLLAVVMNNNF